jgi:cobalamin biosynthesis protein CobW
VIRPPLPVTVVTGFLGAGKTTLLSNLLHDTKRRRLAIVVNEFGEVSIDGALLRDHDRGDEVQVQDVANGLLAYGDDTLFMPLMAQLQARRNLIDHVVIETSGLAVPTAVMERLQSEPSLAEHFVLDATLAVVDTPLLLAGQFDEAGDGGASVAELFRLQIDNADVVVLNKIDGLDKAALIEAETRIRRLAPNVRFIELAHHARLDTRLALGLRLHQPGEGRHSPTYTQVASLQASPVLSRKLDGHSHSGLAPHTHGLLSHKHFHEHDPGWQSFVLHSHAPQTEAVLLAALEQVAQTEPVMRIKGFVHTVLDGQALLIQGVRTRIGATLTDISEATESPDVANAAGDPPRARASDSQLVFIGYHATRKRVAEILTQSTGTEWH